VISPNYANIIKYNQNNDKSIYTMLSGPNTQKHWWCYRWTSKGLFECRNAIRQSNISGQHTMNDYEVQN